MPKLRISLAAKCQILFGAAVVLILFAALSVPWLRMGKLVDEGQIEIARRLADIWINQGIDLNQASLTLPANVPGKSDSTRLAGVQIYSRERNRLEYYVPRDEYLIEKAAWFDTHTARDEVFTSDFIVDGHHVYRYVRAVRQDDLDRSSVGFQADLPATQIANPLRFLLVIEIPTVWGDKQLFLNRIYISIAGVLAGILAIVVFWYITTRIVLSPVHVLRDTAEKVAEGDLNIRSDINTGDEFEQLSTTFNTMLVNLKASQDQLRDLNKQLDLKLDELAKTNVSLFEANRLKGEFLANVSHELRTPMNSIIGFAEVLSETLLGAGETLDEKKTRYVQNILTSARSLLQLINELLDLAKIEAGRVEMHIEQMSVADLCEAMMALMKPQADARKLKLSLVIKGKLPMVRTDPGKLQQVLFNFLSNAVKFTPEEGKVDLGAAATLDPESDQPTGVRFWVRDSGPGIAVEDQQVIFEKFRQLEGAHTRQHGGTGLGLAISRELAKLLNGRIELDSDLGRGATFSITIPLALEARPEPLMPDLVG